MRATFIFGKVFPCWPFLLSEVAKGKTDKQSRTQCAQQIGFTPFFRFRDIYTDPLFVLIIHPPLLDKEENLYSRTINSSVKK